MGDVFLLSQKQLNMIKRHFPTPHGKPRVDDLRVISGIIYVIRQGLQWKDAPAAYGPHKTLYNRFVRWPGRDFQCDLPGAGEERRHQARSDDRRHTSERAQNSGQPAQKGAVPRCIGRTKGGLNSKLHAVCDETGRPVCLLLSEWQMSDDTGARRLLPFLPNATYLIADRGYDADWFRVALKKKGVPPCIPPRKSRRKKPRYSKPLYKLRHKIEVMFGRIKDWRRIAMRYDRCAHTFFSAICIAATVIFYLKE